MGSAGYLAARTAPQAMADLAEHDLIGADAGFQRLEVFRRLHRRFPREQFVATANTMVALAQAGFGLAVLPSDQIGAGLTRLLPFEPRLPAALWLLTHPDLRTVARIRALSDALFEQLTRHPQLVAAREQAGSAG